MITAEQETAAVHAQFWIEQARDMADPIQREACVRRAIRNLMIASHGR